MLSQLDKYLGKLHRDALVKPQRAALLVKDDKLLAQGPADLSSLGAAILERINVLALAIAEPLLPLTDLLIRRAAPDCRTLVPSDTETRTFLHDIPLVRKTELTTGASALLADLLGSRKGIIVEGVGIVTTGAMTPEMAYINWSSVWHAVFVKYLSDLLTTGIRSPDDELMVAALREQYRRPITLADCCVRATPPVERSEIYAQIERIGRCTVDLQLVDSAFGNISWRDGGMIYISQTGASLDELAGCIDPVPCDNSSTVGLTASSELLAHRRIYEATGARAILHGHPKFAVVLSMLCAETGCENIDCWKDCPRIRFLATTPIVPGEIGAGGLADKVAPVIGAAGTALVYGHGVFTLGREHFGEALERLVAVENWCRQEYFRRLVVRMT
ncbi:MAG: class II aldolase/adducin family protein [Desulfuromonadaceae bacterium]|nr:class II aldolase/adducin family protein [Desulfuromonadaceae bacterium]